tara:strand:+ start:1387 stop:2388 length:1002 start_codon:yes stop_codon:yes gene_type:complete
MIYIFSAYVLLVLTLSIYFKKKNYFSNYSGDNHQLTTNENNIPLIGGVFLIIPMILINPSNLILNFFLISIFLIGFFSDKKILTSPKLKFLLQLIIILLSVIFLNLEIISSRVVFFDNILKNYYFNLLFTVFCLLILINGSNFIDGLNSLLISYLAIVIYILIKLNFIPDTIFFENNLSYFFLLLLVLIILNFSNLLILGDAGAYLLSFFVGYLIIKSHNLNIEVSPYFFINLIWLPCFENLFSIVRKLLSKFSPFAPDSNHLHQLIFRSLNRKIFKKKLIANNSSSIFINSFNFTAFYFVSIDPYNTIYQIKLTFLFIICYFLVFFLLKNET